MIWSRFEALASRYPERPAACDDKASFTYRALREQAAQNAAQLAASGFQPGDTAALFLPNGIGFVTGFLAIMHRGGRCLPLHTKYQPSEIAQFLSRAHVRVLFTEERFLPLLRSVLEDLPGPRPQLLEWNASPAAFPPPPPPVPVTAAEPALLQFSTGSTSQAKPVQRTQGQLLAEVRHFGETVHPRPEDRILALVPLFHAHGFGNCLLAALMNGSSLVLAENFAPRPAIKLLSEKRITLFPAVPFIFKMMAETRLDTEPRDFSALRLCFSAGAPLDPSVSASFARVFGQPVRQLYGTTETGSLTLNLDPDPVMFASTVGTPMPSVDIAVFDEERRPLGPGQAGEIGIRSPSLADGYWESPALTSEFFHEEWFFPGDCGSIDAAGRLTITGRKTFFINVGGNKVDPAEVENFLSRHPKLKDAAVVGAAAGYGQLVKAVVVPNEPCTEEEILAFCQDRLASYKIPKLVEFRDEIPRSPLGKILRKYLEEPPH